MDIFIMNEEYIFIVHLLVHGICDANVMMPQGAVSDLSEISPTVVGAYRCTLWFAKPCGPCAVLCIQK